VTIAKIILFRRSMTVFVFSVIEADFYERDFKTENFPTFLLVCAS
jgi:hypothetical protein